VSPATFDLRGGSRRGNFGVERIRQERFVVPPTSQPVRRENDREREKPRKIAKGKETTFGKDAPRGLMRDGDRENEQALWARHRGKREKDAAVGQARPKTRDAGRRFVFRLSSFVLFLRIQRRARKNQKREQRRLQSAHRPQDERAIGSKEKRSKPTDAARRESNDEPNRRQAQQRAEEHTRAPHVYARGFEWNRQRRPEEIREPFDAFAGVEDQSRAAQRVLCVTKRDVRVVHGVHSEREEIKERVSEEERSRQ